MKFLINIQYAIWRSLTALGLCAATCLATASLSTQASVPSVQEIQILDNYMQYKRQNAGLTTRYIQLGNIRWAYNEGGSKQKPTVILLHGLTGHRDHWNTVAALLIPHYHVIIPDLPHNGDTQVPADFNIAIPNVTAQLRLLIEALGVEHDVHIAGHSLGGSIATQYAAAYPFDTQSLFLMNSAGIYKHATTPYSQNPDHLKNLIVSRPGDLETVIHQIMYSPPDFPYALKRAREQKLIERAANDYRMIDQLTMLSRLYTPDSFARLTRSVEAPTLILWGKQDKIISALAASELQHLLKRAEQPIILNNVGHMPMLEAGPLVAQHYLPFLAKAQHLKNPLADKLIPLN